MPKLLTQGVSSEPETGRSLIGIVAGFKSERWPDFDRNGGRLQIGIRIIDNRGPSRQARLSAGSLHANALAEILGGRDSNQKRRLCRQRRSVDSPNTLKVNQYARSSPRLSSQGQKEDAASL